MRANPEFDILHPNRLAHRIIWMLALALPGSVTVSASTLAQVATPAPIVCDAPIRPITFIADLIAAPKPEVTATAVTNVPDGVDVTDPQLRAEVISVVETLIVCVNEGDLLRSFSLFDDEYLRRLIDPDGLMRADVAIELAKSMATPEALDPEDVTVLEEILVVRQLSDGAVVVVFQTRGGPDRDSDETQVDLFILRSVEDQWLIIDGVTDVDPEALTPTT